jgi:hypothetical protein
MRLVELQEEQTTRSMEANPRRVVVIPRRPEVIPGRKEVIFISLSFKRDIGVVLITARERF